MTKASFAPLVRSETYRMRTSSAYKGDYVESRVREIRGRWYEFTRVFWASGAVTVMATPYGRTTRLHEFHGTPVPLSCGHVPSYGCDCDTVAVEADAH
jgi:hypothetical protein